MKLHHRLSFIAFLALGSTLPFPAHCFALDEAVPEPAIEKADDGEDPKPPPPPAEGEDGGDVEDEGAPEHTTAGRSTGAYEPSAVERNAKTSASSFQIARGGKALVPITVANKADSDTLAAAGELAMFLNRITGADFVVQSVDGTPYEYKPYTGPYIKAATRAARRKAAADRDIVNALKPAEPLPQSGLVVGAPAEFEPPADVKDGLEMRGIYHGREAYAIRTSSQRLLVMSNLSRGMYHAVYRLLHEMGCRWFAPSAHWEIVPSTPSLAFNKDITDRPSIGTRIIAFMDGAANGEERIYQGRWTRRNRLGVSFGASTGHNWHNIVEANHNLFLEHPEYFAEVGGKRMMPVRTREDGSKYIVGVFSKFELANPAVRKLFVDYTLEAFRKSPNAEMISLSPTDGGGFSQSEESRKLGSISDAVYGLVNEVARAVKKEFPGKMVGCYAYRETAGPPSFPMEDNVYIEIATLFNMSQYSTAQLLELWPKHAKNIGVYRYFSYYDAGGSEMSGGPIASVKWAADTVRSDYARNTAAIFAQSSNAFAMQMRGYLVATRLMWNPNDDVDAILEDFYEKSFGAAAPAMKRFYGRIGKDIKRSINEYTIAAAYRELDEATKMAKDRPDVLWRLADLKMYLRWHYLRGVMGHTKPNTPEYGKNYAATMRAAQAMAPTYMAQWNMILKKTSRSVAPKIKGLELGDIYKDNPVPTLESVEADFQESLKAMPTREIPYVDYDITDLVPVEFPPGQLQLVPRKAVPLKEGEVAPDPFERGEYYQGSTPMYYFCSFKGEPIEVRVRAGMRGNGNSGRVENWSLSQPDGKGGWKIIETGTVPADKIFKELSIKVPAKGVYGFRFRPGSLAGSISYRTDKPTTVEIRGAKDYPSPMVYIPKGTTEIWLAFNSYNGGSPALIQPDGKLSQRFNSGVYIVPVPPGMDGQIWRWAGKFRGQEFFNIPNLAAPSPETLMVPRAVAIKDGLKIRTQ